MIALDTNLLVYAHRITVPEHQGAKRAIERARAHPGGSAIPSPCIAEFLSVVTSAGHPGHRTRPTEASEFLSALILSGAKVISQRPGFGERLIQLASDLDIVGLRIFDFQIALTAQEGGADEIWTHDQSFTTVPGLKVFDPL